ncbi:MAG: transposase [Elusimicrobia bacterium]|nr:transposase [Elusimicrobiota bacterium]
MVNTNTLPKYKTIRLKDYDYSLDGYYFVTICTKNRNPLFVAAPSNGANKFVTNKFVAAPSNGANKSLKEIVKEKLNLINKYYPGVKIDYSVVMLNHIHIIFVLEDSKISLAKIINAFKSWVTRDIKKGLASQGDAATKGDVVTSIWQPNYYEHIIRNEKALTKIREYIQNNPLVDNINFEQFYEKK